MTAALRRAHRRETVRSDAGFTLVELLVTMLLFGLVLAVAGTLLLNGLKGQRDVIGTGQASNDAQVSITAMERAIRNSSTLQVEAHRLVASTDTGGANPKGVCVAWLYVQSPGATTGRIYFKKGASLLPDVDFPTGWTLVVDGVVPMGGSIFTNLGPKEGLTSVSIAFESKRINEKKDAAGVVLETTVTQRPQTFKEVCS